MAIEKKEHGFNAFLQSKKVSPIIAALGSGVYPIFFYYSNNDTLIGSWEHMRLFLALFVVAPICLFWVASKIVRLPFLRKLEFFVLPFLNIFFFLCYIKIAVSAEIHWLIITGILFLAILIAYFLNRYFKKWVIIQLVLALIGFVTLVPKVITQLNYSREWQQQPDDILQAMFKKKPNIYFIQPDGYVNFSELGKGQYNFDNSIFESFLEQQNFTSYANFRSNYAATLATNSSLFAMKHHYYNKGASFSETTDARHVIMTENAVLTILKNNGYHTSFYSEHPYFLISRPTLGYDKSNFTEKDVSIVTTGMTLKRDVIKDFKNDSLMQDAPTFSFIQLFNPSHITRTNKDTEGIAGEREKYLDGIENANEKLKQLIAIIEARDPNAMIVIMADHGGFVGYEHTGQAYTMTEEITLKRSIFSAILSIKWPKNAPPKFEETLKSPVNLFRILTAYLSEEPRYLDNLQDDSSYLVLKEGVPKGTYQYIDSNGISTLKKQ